MKTGTISTVIDHFFAPEHRSLYGGELDRATKEFFGEGGEAKSPDDFGHFAEWFIFAFTLQSGKTPLEYFYEENPAALSKEALLAYAPMLENFYSVFEVTDIQYGKGFTFTDLITNNTYNISEESMTRQVAPKTTVFCRLLLVDAKEHIYEIAGGSTIYIPAPATEVREQMEKESLETPLDPRSVFHLMKAREAAEQRDEETRGTERPDISSLDLAHAGIEMTRHPGGKIEIMGSYDGPTEDTYDGCPVCVAFDNARKHGNRMPDPEALREAMEEMAWDAFEKQHGPQGEELKYSWITLEKEEAKRGTLSSQSPCQKAHGKAPGKPKKKRPKRKKKPKGASGKKKK